MSNRYIRMESLLGPEKTAEIMLDHADQLVSHQAAPARLALLLHHLLEHHEFVYPSKPPIESPWIKLLADTLHQRLATAA